jgi:IS5 family transposase
VLGYRAGRYAHARQYKRMRKVIQRQRTIVGRKMSALALAVQEALGKTLSQAQRQVSQTASRKNPGKQPKLYSLHAPEVECISKGKSRNPYEFGVKVGIATTLKGNLIVGARTFPGNPYDGHTLQEQVEQASILMQATGVRPQTVYVDLGYRGVDQANPDIAIKHRGRFKSLTGEERKNLKRRQAIEPIIGHLKADHRMNRCHLKGAQGDSLHAVLCAAGYNIRWLLRMIAKKGVPFLQTLFLRLLQHGNLAVMGQWATREMAKFGGEVPGRRRLDASVFWLWAENEFFRGD